MCLDLKKDSKPLIASEDITVYKYGICRGNTFHPYFQTSFIYKKLKVQPTVDLIVKNLDSWNYKDFYIINEGYHSFPSINDTKVLKHKYSHIGIFTIPRGTPYYIGTFLNKECYCSASIVYMGKYRKPFLKPIIKFIKNFLK